MKRARPTRAAGALEEQPSRVVDFRLPEEAFVAAWYCSGQQWIDCHHEDHGHRHRISELSCFSALLLSGLLQRTLFFISKKRVGLIRFDQAILSGAVSETDLHWANLQNDSLIILKGNNNDYQITYTNRLNRGQTEEVWQIEPGWLIANLRIPKTTEFHTETYQFSEWCMGFSE